MTHIGTIVRSNSHIDYVCQIYGVGETERQPDPADYSFATFVGIHLGTGEGPGPYLVGIIYNTLLVNPEFGSLGPRLSPQPDLTVFSPDYLAETATLVGILVIGHVDGGRDTYQGVPPAAATVNSRAFRLTENEVVAFHSDGSGRLRLAYVPLLLGQSDSLMPPLLMALLGRLGNLFGGEKRQLALLRSNLAWRSSVQVAG